MTSINALRASRGADASISLREAIAATNATRNVNSTADQIHFQIQGTGTQTLSVTGSDLAAFSDAVILDATTQNGFAGAPLISIVDGDTRSNGLNLGVGSDEVLFAASIFRGLAQPVSVSIVTTIRSLETGSARMPLELPRLGT